MTMADLPGDLTVATTFCASFEAIEVAVRERPWLVDFDVLSFA